jgi:hypothetical protein
MASNNPAKNIADKIVRPAAFNFRRANKANAPTEQTAQAVIGSVSFIVMLCETTTPARQAEANWVSG